MPATETDRTVKLVAFILLSLGQALQICEVDYECLRKIRISQG